MKEIELFVRKVYKRKRNNWLISRLFLFLSIAISIYLVWYFYNALFIAGGIAWRILPFSFLFSLAPFLWGKPSLRDAVFDIEEKIEKIKGRLYLIVDPFESNYDAQKYRKKAIKETKDILEKSSPEDIVPFGINYYYPVFFLILSGICFTFNLKIEKRNPHPEFTYIESPVKEGANSLILVNARQVPAVYLTKGGRRVEMIKLGEDKYGVLLKVQKTGIIQAEYRGWKTEKRKLLVLPEIEIKELVLKYDYPDYLGLSQFSDTIYSPKQRVEINVLEETYVLFSCSINTPAGSIGGEFNNLRLNGYMISADFSVSKKEKKILSIVDTLKFDTLKFQFCLNPIEDLNPEVKIFYPEVSFQLDERMKAPFRYGAEDDYGIDRINLIYGGEEKNIVDAGGIRFLTDSISLEFGNLLPSETLKVRLEAVDIAGNKSLTPPVLIYMPTLEEMYSDYREISDSLSGITTELERREKEIREQFQKYLSRGDFDEGLKNDIKRVLEEQRDVMEKIDALRGVLEKMEHPEIQRELDRIKEIMDEMGVKELRRNLKSIEKEEEYSTEALKRLNSSMEEFQKHLEFSRKSLESFRKMLQVNDFLNRSEELYEKQKEILAGEPDSLLMEREKSLIEELKNMIEDMQGTGDTSLGRIERKIRGDNLPEKMTELSGIMKQGKIDRKLGDDILESMNSMLEGLRKLKEGRMGESVREKIREKGWELLFVISEHKRLSQKNRDIYDSFIELGLSESIERIRRDLLEVFLKSFAFNPVIIGELGKASGKMRGLSRDMREGSVISNRFERINDILIKAVIKLFTEQPGGMGGLKSALEDIMKEQKSIGQSLQNILPLPSDKQGKQLKELAGRQRELAGKLRGQGDAFKPLASDMEKLAEQMEMGEVDREVMERQNNVLDRLLKAEESVRRRETSKKRRSSPGIYVKPKKIEIKDNLGERKMLIRKILESRKNEQYPEVFSEEIQRYIRELVK